jgi:hypothetical protein
MKRFFVAEVNVSQIKIEQALAVLRFFGNLPSESINIRSALVLLALLELSPETSWDKAKNPFLGVTPIMEFIARKYGKTYAPNSRETFRKATLHHFLRETLVILNPDQPNRATNSPKSVYQISPILLEILRGLETPNWQERMETFTLGIDSRQTKNVSQRNAEKIPVYFGGTELQLSPGGQNPLIRQIIEEFCPRFAAGAQAIYVGDTSSKTDFYNRELFQSLGIILDDHGKMPDVIVYQPEKKWMFLIEAVTTHGAISQTRLGQLQQLFQTPEIGLVFVTAFETRATMRRFLADIAWETEVWIAEAPEHLIHFNGDKFFGPHST